jgi:hypothetical protein
VYLPSPSRLNMKDVDPAVALEKIFTAKMAQLSLAKLL